MDDFEKLVNTIIKQAKRDKEPITREEAEEMARMEIGAKDIVNYTSGADDEEEKKTVTTPPRKIDEDKKYILEFIHQNFNTQIKDIKNVTMKTETELSFDYKDNSYTLKLVKHRPNKKK